MTLPFMTREIRLVVVSRPQANAYRMTVLSGALKQETLEKTVQASMTAGNPTFESSAVTDRRYS